MNQSSTSAVGLTSEEFPITHSAHNIMVAYTSNEFSTSGLHTSLDKSSTSKSPILFITFTIFNLPILLTFVSLATFTTHVEITHIYLLHLD